MSRFLGGLAPGRRILLVAATPLEGQAIARGLSVGLDLAPDPPRSWGPYALTDQIDLVISGPGKVNAAAITALAVKPERHAAVISVGIAGSLPGSGLAVGDVVAANACVYADEGIQTADGFEDLAAMGFPMGPWDGDGSRGGSTLPVAELLLGWMALLTPKLVRIATVSTCSGTDAGAEEVVRRTGAQAEAMEGAAVAHVAALLGVPGGELRAISNTTGERSRQVWNIKAALAALERTISRI